MVKASRYDEIGAGYSRLRREEPRIAVQILDALGDAVDVVNVGAGSGSYEPRDRWVVAVEPSRVMIGQRPTGSAPAVVATAEALPFRDEAFGAGLAVLTIHHWSDVERGLTELRRTSRDRIVLLTIDPSVRGFWLMDYFPEIRELDRRILPPLSEIQRCVGRARIIDVLIPHDCRDGFLGAYWRRPEAYLREDIRAAISTFSRLSDLEHGLNALKRDLDSGEWLERHGQLLGHAAVDLGYRLLVVDA
jgi:SAM-dependent methyltransferase